MGYPYILSLIFRIFGDSLNTGLYFGVLSSIVCSFFIYKIVRYISGSIAALFAVFISTFWPSQFSLATFLHQNLYLMYAIWMFSMVCLYNKKI